MLRLKNITKDYYVAGSAVNALKGITLDFKESEFVSVLGPSGCGKTTLLNIIGGLDKYTDGDLIIKGKSTKNFTDSDWDTYRNHSIGFVFQSYNLIPHLSVLGNVELALTLSGASKEERKNKATSVLERVGLGDQLSKRPNQLSGGQMQRVAIARALVNDPEILLTDEPTGALDSETSVQIMDLIKEISGERLVIMVTHNPEIAKAYSTRVIKLLDGNVISDDNPPSEEELAKFEKPEVSPEKQAQQQAAKDDKKPTKKKNKKSKGKKTSMSMFTAFNLSGRNLISKKVRTIITAIAGSIGIIGIALVLSLSNGFSMYINKMQSDTMSNYPLTIEEVSMDLNSVLNGNLDSAKLEKYPKLKEIYSNSLMSMIKDIIGSNDLAGTGENDIIPYLEKMDKDLYYALQKEYGLVIGKNIYTNLKLFDPDNLDADLTETKMSLEYLNAFIAKMTAANISGSMSGMGNMFASSFDIFNEMPDNQDFISSQYDLIGGSMPTEYNEVVLVVDEFNQLPDITLAMLGLKGLNKNAFAGNINPDNLGDILDTQSTIDFDTILGKDGQKGMTFTLYLNNDVYSYDAAANSGAGGYKVNALLQNGEEIIVTGILRPNKETSMGALNSGIAYTKALTDYIMADAINSDIVQWMIDNDLTETSVAPAANQIGAAPVTASIRDLGGNNIPKSLKIYAKDYESKKLIKTYIADYTTVSGGTEIKYMDSMDLLFSVMNTMVDAVSYVLIAFTAISLVVSSIMIGIITYVSVVERTKEIGVLRSIGARKKDISRVFNAETFIIGFAAGLFGIIVAALLTIPINLIIGVFVEGIGNIAVLNVFHGIILVVISVLLTLIAGLIPSRIAAKKDPVVALRNE